MGYLKKVGPQKNPGIGYFFALVFTVYSLCIFLMIVGIGGGKLLALSRGVESLPNSSIEIIVKAYLVGSLIFSVGATMLSLRPLKYRFFAIEISGVEIFDDYKNQKIKKEELKWQDIGELRISKSNFLIRKFFKKEFSASIVDKGKPTPRLFTMGGCDIDEVKKVIEIFNTQEISTRVFFDKNILDLKVNS